MGFNTYVIGRSVKSDIVLKHPSVGRLCAEITIIEGSSKVFLIDRCSTNGIYKKKAGQWETFVQGFVNMTDELRFGGYEINVELLTSKLTKSQKSVDTPTFEAISIRPKRNRSTGQIEK